LYPHTPLEHLVQEVVIAAAYSDRGEDLRHVLWKAACFSRVGFWRGKNRSFEVDRGRERFYLTSNPGGFLRRIG